jgi:hypothetical protein
VEPELGLVGEQEEGEEERVEWDGLAGSNTWSHLIPPRHLSPKMLLHSIAAGSVHLQN